MNRIRKIPLVTLIIAALALVIALLPAVVAEALQFDRTAFFARGQMWSLFTAHLTHFGVSHFLWNLVLWLVLGTMAERRSRYAMALTLGLAAPLIVLAVWLAQPQFVVYRGLSGLDSALFIFLTAQIFREGFRVRPRHWGSMILGGLCMLGFAAKCLWELTTGASFFADSASEMFSPVPLAHLVGGMVGGLVGCYSLPKEKCSVIDPDTVTSCALDMQNGN